MIVVIPESLFTNISNKDINQTVGTKDGVACLEETKQLLHH